MAKIERPAMLKLMQDLEPSVRGVYRQGAFHGLCILVAYDSAGTLRRKVEVPNTDLESDEIEQLRAWLDRHDPL